MATRKKFSHDEYEEMTVPQLRELADDRGIEIPSTARKEEIIALLEGNGSDNKEAGDKDAKDGKDAKDAKPPGAADTAVGKAAPKADPKTAPVDPYADFEDPVTDGSKPIINQVSPGDPVLALVFDGSNCLTLPAGAEDHDHLVFVQSRGSQEWLMGEAAKTKFVQDKTGQIYYNSRGAAAGPDYKPVDMVALGT